MNKEGSLGPFLGALSLEESCPCLFVQILPAQMLFDVFKGAILMLGIEGKRRFGWGSSLSYFSLRKVPVWG